MNLSDFPWEWAILFLSIGMIVGGIDGYWRGFHNVDLSANMFILGHADVHDHVSLGETVSYRDLYIIGINQMNSGFYGMALGAAFLGASAVLLVLKLNKARK